MNELKRQIEYVLRGDGSKSKTAKDKNINELVILYDKFDHHVIEKEYVNAYGGLFELTKHIFKLARKEFEENQEKWDHLSEHEKTQKKEGQNKKLKIRYPLFELWVRHLKTCRRTHMDYNTVPWIPYCLTLLKFKWIQKDEGMEIEISNLLMLCSMASSIQWAEHSHLKALWDFMWYRVEDSKLEENILKNYIEMAVEMMKNVDFVVYEESAIGVVSRVIVTLKNAMKGIDQKKE
ncbi:hypothetical protein CRE_03818 [Caenorhabditis remanei]|uniref:Uncharacterized protein n=1 Tax=Caenorhabditis remanei TaxID=31234 RepID=E3LXA2_CAERE|nr:hypothetical protein CRE_03818 [Caenorhabditis remanei]